MASEPETFTLLDLIHDAIVVGQQVGHRQPASKLVNLVLAGAKRHGYALDLTLTLADLGTPVPAPAEPALASDRR